MIQPVRDHILIEVQRPAQEAKTQSGIILKTQAPQKRTIGKVIAVGKGRVLDSGQVLTSDIGVGDEVIFYDYAGVMVSAADQDADKDYLIIKQNDVMAIVTSAGDTGGLI